MTRYVPNELYIEYQSILLYKIYRSYSCLYNLLGNVSCICYIDTITYQRVVLKYFCLTKKNSPFVLQLTFYISSTRRKKKETKIVSSP